MWHVLVTTTRNDTGADVRVGYGKSAEIVSNAELANAKNCVGNLKLRYGEKPWYSAVSYTDSFSTLALNHRRASRAYFKLVELAELVPPLTSRQSVLHLAEAPGGFVQAAHEMCPETTWVAHSLEGDGTIRFARQLPAGGKVLTFGEKHGRGNLCDDRALAHMCDNRNAFDLITADGSVDIDNDHANAETCNFALTVRETLIARRLCRIGGSFVVKVFDVAHECTLGLVQLLTQWFANVSLAKPCASRSSNGELYVVCTGALPPTTGEGDVLARLQAASHSSQPRIAKIFDALDPDVCQGLTKAVRELQHAQLAALKGVFDTLEGRVAPMKDKTEAWWKGPGARLKGR